MRIVAKSSVLNSKLNRDFLVRVFPYPFRKVRIMLRVLCLTTTVLLIPWGAVFAEQNPDSKGNAALKYWQAFATLPKFTDAENKIIGDCLTAPLDDTTRKILTSSEYSLTMLHRAAAVPRCEWSMSYEDGVFALLPQCPAARVLASLACLRARQRFEAGQTAEAIDDLLTAMTLGRHISVDGSLIAVLVGYSVEARAIETFAHALPTFNPKTVNDIKTRVEALPPFGTVATALLACEKETLDWFIRKVSETKDKEGLLKFLSWVGISEEKDRDTGSKAAEFLKECGGTAAGVTNFAVETLPSYNKLAKSLNLPLDEFEKEFERESIRQAGNPVYKVFFPSLAKARQSSVRADVRRALFLAALAVQLDGQSALKDYFDPFGGGRFKYAPFKGGFELHSKIKGQDDKPVTLTVGHRN